MLTLDVVTGSVGTTMSAERALGVELLETLFISGNAAVSPDLLALKIQRRANAVVTVSGVVRAGIAVLLVDILWALTGLAGTDFR